MLDICCVNDVHESVVKFDSSDEEKKLKTWKVLMIKHLLPHSYMYLFRRAINIHINNLCGPDFNLYRFSTLMSETSLPNYTGKQKKCHIFYIVALVYQIIEWFLKHSLLLDQEQLLQNQCWKYSVQHFCCRSVYLGHCCTKENAILV